MAKERKYKSFSTFYPYYLTEHSNPTCRMLHFVGTSLAVTLAVSAFVFNNYLLLAFVLPCGYAFAWVGHFFIEKNNTTEFSNEDAEYQELLRQYLVLKGLQDNAVNRIKFGIMKKEELEKALGY